MVSLYLKFIVMLDFLAVATVVPLLPQYFARSVSKRAPRACVCMWTRPVVGHGMPTTPH